MRNGRWPSLPVLPIVFAHFSSNKRIGVHDNDRCACPKQQWNNCRKQFALAISKLNFPRMKIHRVMSANVAPIVDYRYKLSCPMDPTRQQPLQWLHWCGSWQLIHNDVAFMPTKSFGRGVARLKHLSRVRSTNCDDVPNSKKDETCLCG